MKRILLRRNAGSLASMVLKIKKGVPQGTFFTVALHYLD